MLKKLNVFFSDKDGHAYFINGNKLLACPVFVDGELDLDNINDVSDFVLPLDDKDKIEIVNALLEIK